MTKRKRKTSNRPMPPAAVRSWRNELRLSERDASKRLGISRQAYRNAEEYGATLTVGLACAALIKRLRPYGMDDKGNWIINA